MRPTKKAPEVGRQRIRLVRIDEDIFRKLRLMATVYDVSVPDLINERLQALVAKEWPDVVKKMSATQ